MTPALMCFLFGFFFIPFPGQQAVGVPAQRKGNPPDHRRRERQEAGRQTGQQLNWSDAQADIWCSNKLIYQKLPSPSSLRSSLNGNSLFVTGKLVNSGEFGTDSD